MSNKPSWRGTLAAVLAYLLLVGMFVADATRRSPITIAEREVTQNAR